MSFVSFRLQGMVFLTMTVSVPGLKPPDCPTNIGCEPASKLQIRVFYTALYVVAVGVGGIKPCFSSLGAQHYHTNFPSSRPKVVAKTFFSIVSEQLTTKPDRFSN
jgi:dipeptide/tripeptide permease